MDTHKAVQAARSGRTGLLVDDKEKKILFVKREILLSKQVRISL